MSVRAGIVVTGTEVLTGRISDRNGPWLAERLFELGIDIDHTVIVGDRPQDVLDALGWMRDLGCGVVITSGGLGPTEDDLTMDCVARFQGRSMELDDALADRIGEIQTTLLRRWADIDRGALEAARDKQATVPSGATVLEPVGTAPGAVAAPANGSGPVVVVLPGPPRELQGMWPAALESAEFREAISARRQLSESVLRLFGIPESEIAATLRETRARGIDLDALEVTTCLRRGEVEIVTRFTEEQDDLRRAFEQVVRERHADTLFSDGETIDQQVARLLIARDATVAVAESCTGGLLAGRLTEAPGASRYVLGGVVAYSDAAKAELVGVDPDLIARHGAVSPEVAEALARGATERFSADVGIGVTGVAGPGGGTPEKPVGTVCLSVVLRDGEAYGRRMHMHGGRADVRDRSTTIALHLLRLALVGRGLAGGTR